jgi:hypothetical protein
MRKRLKTLAGASAALAALALGGSALASATQATSHAKKHAVAAAEQSGGPDADSVQSGDQSAPDTSAVKASSASQADTTAPESSSESSSEPSSPGDGPGGHEDPPGNVDYQSEAQE